MVPIGVKDFGDFKFWFVINNEWQGWVEHNQGSDSGLLVPTWIQGKLSVQHRDCLEVIG